MADNNKPVEQKTVERVAIAISTTKPTPVSQETVDTFAKWMKENK